jgi:hypothetical protein
MKGKYANDELERIWKKAVVNQFKVLSRHLTAETEENHKDLKSV